MSNKDRVATAVERYFSKTQELLSSKAIRPSAYELHLRAYKAEALLEVWAKNTSDQQWRLIKDYPFCTTSGTHGPKRKEGDLQIPEGFYYINRFNHKSKFHLSLGLNYPNNSDLKLGDPNRPGSDIFIHGGCQSVGCIAITDPMIEELFVLTTEAKNQGQQEIPVYIFPCKMESPNLEKLYTLLPQHRSFWENLKEEVAFFNKENTLRDFSISEKGKYIFDSK